MQHHLCVEVRDFHKHRREHAETTNIMSIAFEILLGLVFLTSACICGLLVAASRDVPRLAGRASDLFATQKTHVRMTPRVGGLGIFSGVIFGTYLVSIYSDQWTFFRMGQILVGPILLVVIALAEDLGFHVRATGRLVATFIASLIVGLSTGIWLETLGFGPFDGWMQHVWLSIPVTLFLTATLAHGFNLIDGVNGLSASAGLLGAVACGIVAFNSGATEIALMSLILAAAITGFLCFNFPFGWIFLGDTGAYLIGFTLAWLGIALVQTTGTISAWTLVLLFFWPLADVLFAVIRRLIRRRNPFDPDRLHLHSIVNRALIILGSQYPVIGRWRNPVTTILLLPMVAAPPILGIVLAGKTPLVFFAVIGCTGAYATLLLTARPLYRTVCRLTEFRRRRAGETILSQPQP
jgi:UDP-GlcNAc:undecaprenyl-phosphate/decaprenyl-phosphate GlcNAc-1-phosphate transferase